LLLVGSSADPRPRHSRRAAASPRPTPPRSATAPLRWCSRAATRCAARASCRSRAWSRTQGMRRASRTSRARPCTRPTPHSRALGSRRATSTCSRSTRRSPRSRCCARQLDVPLARVNVRGGAVALGHPIGASGARIVATLTYALTDLRKQRGVATVCLGGGEALALVLERP